MPSQPAVLIIPGGCHVQAHYIPLQGALEAYGYQVINLALQANSNLPPKKSIRFDIDMVRHVAEGLANQRREIIVLMHSYGGFLGTEALAGLGIKEWSAQGLKGGVKGLAYMTALIPVQGEGFFDTLEVAGPVLTGALHDAWANSLVIIPKYPGPSFYQDLQQDAQDHWSRLITGFAVENRTAKLTSEAWRNIDVSYMLTTLDEALPPETQKRMIGRIEELSIPVKLYKVEASHSPFLSRIGGVLRWINGLAGIE